MMMPMKHPSFGIGLWFVVILITSMALSGCGLLNHEDIPQFRTPHSKILFQKSVPYTQWTPFQTTQHQIIFIDNFSINGKYPLTTMVRFDPQTASFGPEEPIRSVVLGQQGIILNGYELQHSLSNPLFERHYQTFCQPFRNTIAKQLHSTDFYCASLGFSQFWVSLNSVSPTNKRKFYLYNPAKQTLREILNSQNKLLHPYASTSYRLSNGQILFLPPFGKTTQKTCLFDLSTNRIIELKTAVHWPYRPTFAETKNNVLIVGGMSEWGRPDKTTYLYNILSKQLVPGPSLERDHGNRTSAITLKNGDILVTGGDLSGEIKGWFGSRQVERYDSHQNRFTVVGQMASPRVFHHLLLLGNDTVLIIGGNATNTWPDTGDLWYPIHSIEVFRP